MFSSNLSNFSQGVNTAFIVILGIIGFFLVGLTAVLIYFIVKYRASKHPVASQVSGNTTLEIIWTLIPLLLVLGMFYFGWVAWKPMESRPPRNAMHIKTTARMWNWSFTYENGKVTDTLYIPVGLPVALDMEALDVIHSLYIPVFRIKKDIVPGTPRLTWFIANSPGSYDLFCTEYCGLQHSTMITLVKALPGEDFEAWYASLDTTSAQSTVQIAPPASEEGRKLIKQVGCTACHTTDGTRLVGPTYKGLFGKTEIVITGKEERTITVDEAYIRTSILDPNKDIVKGYTKGLMLSYGNQLNEEEIQKIIDYLRTLQ